MKCMVISGALITNTNVPPGATSYSIDIKVKDNCYENTATLTINVDYGKKTFDSLDTCTICAPPLCKK